MLYALSSWRLGSVTLLSLSSGLPLGLVLTAMPAWLAEAKVDIKTIGLLTLVQAPYGFKFLWSPLMDRLRPPFLGFRRGWILLCQLLLAAGTAALGATAGSPTIGLVAALALLISFASASQDIVYDAWAVEVLEKHEHGYAVGARSAVYRAGMWTSGNIAITLAPLWGWQWTLMAQAAVYLALLPVTVFAPEPKVPPDTPKSLRAAVWEPFVGFLGRPRALEILSFVLLYRLADSLAGALVSPFLIQKGYSPVDVGVLRGAVGVGGTLLGTFLGGLLAGRVGVGRALWICGVLQIVSNVGYAVVAQAEPDTLLLQGAIAIESATSGMGWGAFGVLLLRLTDRRFSATQYALFSSLVGLARTFVGPPAGLMADALGWRDFFLLSMAFGVPGMVMLKRFVPWGQEPKEISGEHLEPLPPGPPWPKRALWTTGLLNVALGGGVALLLTALMGALKRWRTEKVFDFADALLASALPGSAAQAVDLIGSVIFGVVWGLAVAAWMAARGRQAAPT